MTLRTTLSRLRDAIDTLTIALMVLVATLYLAPLTYLDNDDPTWGQTLWAMVGAMLFMATVWAAAVGVGVV